MFFVVFPPSVPLWLILRVVFPSVEDCFVFCVWGLCLPFSSLRQWAVDVFEAVQRPSSVPLQFMVACPSPFTPVSRRVSRPSARTSCPRTGGCWRLSAWFGCASQCVFFSLLLSMSVHRVPSREEVCCVLACHLVPCCVVLPWTTLASKVMVIFRTVLDAAVRFAPAPYSCSVLTVEMCLLPGAGSGSGGGGGGGKSLFSWWLSPLCVWCTVTCMLSPPCHWAGFMSDV